jgi:hypothetical protein
VLQEQDGVRGDARADVGVPGALDVPRPLVGNRLLAEAEMLHEERGTGRHVGSVRRVPESDRALTGLDDATVVTLRPPVGSTCVTAPRRGSARRPGLRSNPSTRPPTIATSVRASVAFVMGLTAFERAS